MILSKSLAALFRVPVRASGRFLACDLIRLGFLGVVLGGVSGHPKTTAQELPIEPAKITRSEPVDFSKEILPLFQRSCQACHHAKQAEGGLVVESHDDLIKGGDSGAGIVPGDVDASYVFARASGQAEPLMPPEGNGVGAEAFTPKELALLQLWIQQGATGGAESDAESLRWQSIPEQLHPIYAVASSPDGRYIASGNANQVTIYDAITMQPVDRLGVPELSTEQQPVAGRDMVQSIAFSRDGKTLATGGFRSVRLWQRSDRPLSTAKTPFANAAGEVAANADRSRVAVVNAIGEIEIWDTREPALTARLVGHAGAIRDLVWAGKTDRLFSVDHTGSLRVWNPNTGKQLLQVEAPKTPSDLAVSADGQSLVMVDGDSKIHAWSLNKPAEDHPEKSSEALIARKETDWNSTLKTLLTKGDARSIVFAPSPSSELVIATKSGEVFVVDLAAGSLIRTFEHGAPLNAIVVGGDPLRLVSAAEDGTNRLWDFSSGEAIGELGDAPQLRRHRNAAQRDVQRQEMRLKRLTQQKDKATQRAESEAEALANAEKLRDEAATKLKSVQKKLDEVKASLAESQRDRKQTQQAIAAAKKKKKANAEKLAQAEKHAAESDESTTDLAALKEQLDAVTSQIKELNAKQEQQKSRVEAKEKQVTKAEKAKSDQQQELAEREQAFETAEQANQRATAAVDQQTRLIASEQRRSTALKQRLAAKDDSLRASKHDPFVTGIFSGSQQNRIVMARADGTVRSFRAADGSALDQFQIDSVTPHGLLMVAEQQLLVFGTDGPAKLVSLEPDWELQQTIGTSTASVISDRVTAMDFHPNGQALAVGSGPPSRFGEVKIFAIPSGRVLREWKEVHSDTVLGVQFSPDGRRLASAAADKTVRLLDVLSGAQHQSLEGHSHHVLDVAWQEDGQTLVSASADQTVKVWNAETGEQQRTIQGFAKEITAVTFVGQSSRIATACADGHVRLHDVTNGKAIRSFNASGDFLFAAAVTEDKDTLVAGGQSGVLRSWSLSNGKLQHETAAK